MLDDSTECYEGFLRTLEFLEDNAKHILVKNLGRCEDWEGFDHFITPELIAQYQIKIIELPKLRWDTAITVYKNALNFTKARRYSEFSTAQLAGLRGYLRRAYSVLNNAGFHVENLMNLEKSICDRTIQSIDESNSKIKAELLKSCKLQMIVVKNSSALSIGCPNSWTAKRVSEFLIGYLDRVLHSMGIDRAVMDDGERMKAYYEWDITNFALRGHFLDRDKFIPIPSDEDLGIF